MDGLMLLAAVAAGFIYGITPGPGVLAVFNIGTDRGRHAARRFLGGHFFGDVVWSALALVSIIGVSKIDPAVFIFVSTISGIYLIWLGCNTFSSISEKAGLVRGNYAHKPLAHGLLFGLTNPKAYPVSAATLTALLSSKAGALSWPSLPLLLMATSIGSLMAYAILVQVVGLKTVGSTYRRYEGLISRMSGILFIGFGCHALLQSFSGLMAMRRP